MKAYLTLSPFALGAFAFPGIPQAAELARRQAATGLPAAIAASKAEGNCGVVPCPTFSEKDQFVSTTGQHAFASPAADQIRGPCPGLNAAANHGYFPRSGVLTVEQTSTGLLQAFGFEPAFAAALAAFAIVTQGSLVDGTWSIGGPQPYTNLGGLLAPPQGISYSHNKYEGDASIGRNDAYLGNGDAHSLNLTRFMQSYEIGLPDDRFTVHNLRQSFDLKVEQSIQENPFYFSPVVAGAVVPSGAHYFIINMMSNHSAEEPNGYLDGEMLKTFFGVSGDYPNFVWNKGQERIPDNWYRRPSYNTYGAQNLVGDLAIQWAAFPNSLRLGGNTNGVDTYKGIDIATFTKGQYNAVTLLEDNNFGCLAFQSMELLLPDFLKGGINQLAGATRLLNTFMAPIIGQLGCPELDGLDQGVFNEYPGHTYSPTGPATNY